MKAPAEAQVRRTLLLIGGIALSTWEIVVRHAQEPAVFIFLAAWLGFRPAVKLDSLLRQPAPETPAPEAAKEAVSP